MAFRSRPQSRFQLELPALELEELARRYCWLRYIDTLGIYKRSPLALLGLAQGLRGSLGLGVASDRGALVVGGVSPLEHLYRPLPTSLSDAVAMGLLAHGQADAILGELSFDGDLITQVELLGEAVRLGLKLVVVAEADDVRGIEAARSLGWQIEGLDGGDLLQGWNLGRSLWHGFQDQATPVVVVLNGSGDDFDVSELVNISPSALDRFEREAIEAASRLSDDPRPDLARTAAKRKLATTMNESAIESVSELVTTLATNLGPGSILVATGAADRVRAFGHRQLIRLSDPRPLAEALLRWGGFPVVITSRAPDRGSPSDAVIMTFDRDVRPGETGVFVESHEELTYFMGRLMGDAVPLTRDYLIVGEHLGRDGFGRVEHPTGRWLRPVSDLAVITWGRGAEVALRACAFLEESAGHVGVLQLHQPGLVDEKLLAQAMTARRICVLYDRTPDVGYQLVAYLQEYFFSQLGAPVLLRSVRPGPGPIAVVLRGLLS